jgi:hypothetical protein
MVEPGSQSSVDLGVALIGMAPPQILTHHVDPVIMEGECHAKPVGNSFSCGAVVHDSNCTAFPGVAGDERSSTGRIDRTTANGSAG